MRGKSTAEEKHAHDDQDGEKLQPDAPAHQRLREIGIAAARHIRDPGEQNEEHCAERHRNKNIAPTYTVHRIGSWWLLSLRAPLCSGCFAWLATIVRQ